MFLENLYFILAKSHVPVLALSQTSKFLHCTFVETEQGANKNLNLYTMNRKNDTVLFM